MKLKKIASLALAGIMAVSMLAACGEGTGSSSSSSEPTVDSSLAGQVIAALSTKTTKYTTFSANDEHLEIVLQKALEGKGTDAASSLQGKDLMDVDSTIGSTSALAAVESDKTSADGDDSNVQKLVFVKSATASSDTSAAHLLAQAIDKPGPIAATSLVWDNLPEQSKWDNPVLADATYYWSFKYTADVAVEKVTNPTTGVTTYVAAVVVTRTPTKVDL